MHKTIFATATALALAFAGPAAAGGLSVEKSFDLGAKGSALSEGGTSGGTYAKGKNGSGAFSFSENFVTNFGKVSVCAGCEATDVRTSEGWGKSRVNTNGAGSVGEAFSQRETFGKSKTSFDVNVEKSVEFDSSFGLFSN